MRRLKITQERCCGGSYITEQRDDRTVVKLPAQGGGILLPELAKSKERYLTFRAENLENHSIAMELRFYSNRQLEDKSRRAETQGGYAEDHMAFAGDSRQAEEENCQAAGDGGRVVPIGEEPQFSIRFGILPGVRTRVCMDREWLKGTVLFPEPEVGQLKLVCHGSRIEEGEIGRVELYVLPAFHGLTLVLSDLVLREEWVGFYLDRVSLVDKFGQNKKKEWPGKTRSLEEMKERLERQEAKSAGYPEDWSVYGGWKKKKLAQGTGFFTRHKDNGRWSLVDPEGYAFFSAGPDCVGTRIDCRVDGVEEWLDWLPETYDSEYGSMFRRYEREKGAEGRRQGKSFSYGEANLYRVWGKDWFIHWSRWVTGQLRGLGMNTLGNWSDERLFGKNEMPYVTSLPEFPRTIQRIFRDFPDVFSDEYVREAKRCAAALEKRKDDPWMIGYFLRNEPNWAFAEPLVLADEVLYQQEDSFTKVELVRFLREKYQTIQRLNQAYHCQLKDFADFYTPKKDVSHWSKVAEADMREFSRRMLRAYVEIPCRECRKVDKNHMILGMRWAWISDPDLVTGWENFDVFSINCYAVDPTERLEQVAGLRVDLPVMIGEFHFGALDAGLTSTGLEGVASQKDRGIAYRYYSQRTAAHPLGVGCHYFQCYDQFVLGRFDGENYNIGLFDICSRPYEEMLEEVSRCSREIYQVKFGQRPPSEEKAKSIPMIAF